MSQERHRSIVDARRRLLGPIRSAAFWLAVLIPLSYPPALVAADGRLEDLLLIAALLVVHLVAQSLGHRHRPD